MAKRPTQITARPPIAPDQIDKATYVGSPEHKERRWWGGLPEAYVSSDGKADRPRRQLTTICPLVTEEERETATGWVRCALRAGQLRFYEGDKDFPNHIWYKEESGRLWFGRCVNGIQGQYKGWPIQEDERVAIFG